MTRLPSSYPRRARVIRLRPFAAALGITLSLGACGNRSQEAEKTAQMWSMIKTGGIALGIALLVLIVWLRSRRNREEYEEYEDEQTEERIQVESIRDPALDDRAALLEAQQRERVRGEISEMVSDRPDEVATMLRGWFADAK